MSSHAKKFKEVRQTQIAMPVGQMEAAMRLKELADQSKGQFALAFVDETGHNPSEMVMVYGQMMHEGRPVFSVRYDKSEHVEELFGYRDLARVLVGLLDKENIAEAQKMLSEHIEKFPLVG